MRGQASLDLMLMTGLGLMLVIALFALALLQSTDVMREWAAQDAVNKVAKLSDNLYGLGVGSRDVASVYVPEGVKTVNISSNTVRITLSSSVGTDDIYADTQATLNGSFNANPGWQRVGLVVNSTGAVQIRNMS